MILAESAQMYLETILILTKSSANVRSIDIVEYMGFSKPSVSRAVKNLRERGYITVDRSGYIKLTENGLFEANKMYERHRIISRLLALLGVDEKTATDDACKIEHVISDESFEKIKNSLEKLEIIPET